MKNVRLKFLLIFFLFLSFSYQGYADCPPLVQSNTKAEADLSKIGKGAGNFFSFKWHNLNFDEKVLQYIKVTAIKDQGIDGYFNPKIQVCDYEGNDNCYELPSGTSCHKIYGTQSTGAGVSAMVFIDWEGNKTSINAKMGEGLEWDWADDVTEEAKKEFKNSPKICACSQKGACMSGASAYFARVGQGANIFSPGEMENVCDTCYQTKVKCAPVPLAPGPPPFCEQLGMSSPQVRIVPIANNDYFDSKVKVIVGNILKEENGEIGRKIGFPTEHGKDKAKEHPPISDKHGTQYYFTTYREKGKLCAEYYGTETEESKRKLQFTRCFPAPHAPKPEIVEILKNQNGSPSNMLKIKMKMNEVMCDKQKNRAYENGFCTFDINTVPTKNTGPLSLEVIKPKIVEKTTDSSDNKSAIDAIIEKILDQRKDKNFKILKEWGFVPDIKAECELDAKGKCKLDSLGQPEIEVKYKTNDKSKMLCISGWKPEPEEFILERGDEIIPLKKMGASYAKYNTVFSKESNQSYYLPRNETADLLADNLHKLDDMIFNKQGYISIPGDKEHCKVDKDSEIDAKQNSNECKIAYKLKDAEHKEIGCKQGDEGNKGDDGCICYNGQCERSTQYIDKRDNKPFYLRVSQKSDGTIEKVETPIKADRTEVFYADKLCVFDLGNLKEKLKETIMKQLEIQKLDLSSRKNKSYGLSGKDDYTDSLSSFDHVEIEAWGGGEAGHIHGKAHSTENRQGKPGDYIKAKLKIDPNYPIIQVTVADGGGNREDMESDKNGLPTIIKMCDLSKLNCQPLTTVAGGGIGTTKIYRKDLILEEKTVDRSDLEFSLDSFVENNKIAYIQNGEIKHEIVSGCNSASIKIPGAGGCINQSGKSYSKGSPGHVNIKPVIGEIDDKKIEGAIGEIVKDPSITTIDDPLINALEPKIVEKIREQIRKELSGS